MTPIARGVDHSPECKVTWTDVVNGSEHFTFQEDSPIELRFGLEVSPSFWDMTEENDTGFAWFCTYRFGGLVVPEHTESFVTKELPGAGSTELWLGLPFGKGSEVTANRNGVFQFRPQIWFRPNPFANRPSKFAVAERDHSFVVDMGGDFSGWSSGTQLVGGAGTPDGTPLP